MGPRERVSNALTKGVIRGEKSEMTGGAMPRRMWRPVSPRPEARPHVADDVREAVDAQAAVLVATLKRRFCKKPKNPQFNWCEDIFVRWHRESLYVVAVMRTPQGRPPTFEMHAARMEHTGEGKFNQAVPMRRGWNTVMKKKSPEECLKEIGELVVF
jgi:hypothetical protein